MLKANTPKAEPLYQRSLAIRETTLGPEHPDVATSLENYASLLRKIGRPEHATPLGETPPEHRKPICYATSLVL